MSTTILRYHYPLDCFGSQARKKLVELSLAKLEGDYCKEDDEYANLLMLFLEVINQPYLPYPITKMRAYSEYLARLGDFLYCPDEEVPEGQEPPAAFRDLYLEPYRNIR